MRSSLSSIARRGLVVWLLAVFMLLPSLLLAEDAKLAEQRISESARYLSSDELAGRGIGSPGLDLAADYIAAEFRKLGLKTELFDGSPFQTFTMTTGAKLGKTNEVVLTGPESGEKGKPETTSLKLDEDFNPLTLGGSGKLDMPLVFVGYGITAPKEKYDDYAGLDVKGKAVIALRHEPQQNNPHSAFNGTKDSQYAPFVRKISNAYEHGAAAIIFVTDDYDIRRRVEARRKAWQSAIDKLTAADKKFQAIEKPTLEELAAHRKQVHELADQIQKQGDRLAEEYDQVLRFNIAGLQNSRRDMPVLHMRRSVLDPMVKQVLGEDLASLERKIDQGPTPQSHELDGWRITGEVTVERTEAPVKNVAAVLEGSGPLADETVVVGAHYDHVGRGGPGSGAINPNVNEIHNGADDNGSGTVALIEVARMLAQQAQDNPDKPRRRVLFIAFTGEERGLIGSARYVRSPLYDLENTVAMLNMDMVGRLNEEKLIIQGIDTATEFEPLVDRLNKQYGFTLTKKKGGFGPSDHSSFYAKQIPVMHFFTGTHKDYHRPSDDYDKLNISGMRRIGEMVAGATADLAYAEKRPTYQASKAPVAQGRGGDRPYFGSIPDFSQDVPGYALTGVTEGGPAAKAGLKAGDVIVRLGDSKIGGLEDFDSALRKYKGGDKVPVVVLRDGKEVKLQVTLDPPR